MPSAGRRRPGPVRAQARSLCLAPREPVHRQRGHRLFAPPDFAPYPLPSLAVIGTGKRVGKTAVTGHIARLLARDRDLVVVAMGRGGPPEPELAEVRPTLERLLELSREGRHAASDYLETE